MRRPGWLYERRPRGAGHWLSLVLTPLALVYGLGAGLHRWLRRRTPWRPAPLGCRVISVGSLVAGGTGKTPVAAWIARSLRARGYRVALATRGYGRSDRARVRVLSDGERVVSDPTGVGDEPLVLLAHAPGVPVVVAGDRRLAALRAISAFDSDVIVLDDGFQHHRLARDIDVVTFDGAVGLGNGRVLPSGPLREGLAALAQADVLGVVDGPLSDLDEARIARRCGSAFRFAARRRATRLRRLDGGEGGALASLAGREVGLLSGIAVPESFERSVASLGARVVARRSFPDHHVYRQRDLRGLASEAELWLTTEKDAVKILPAWLGELDLRVVIIDLCLDDEDAGKGLLDWLETRLAEPEP
jgi:tetraacyldisaccharide 4'-kinase